MRVALLLCILSLCSALEANFTKTIGVWSVSVGSYANGTFTFSASMNLEQTGNSPKTTIRISTGGKSWSTQSLALSNGIARYTSEEDAQAFLKVVEDFFKDVPNVPETEEPKPKTKTRR